MVFSVLSGAII